MARRYRPRFSDPRVALGLGVILVGAGWYCLWDAFAGRGQPTPRPLRPFTAPFV